MSSLEEDKLKECRIIFDEFDKDKDGNILTSDLGDVMRILGAAPSEEELDQIKEEIESNGDNLVNFETFLKIFENQLQNQDSEEDIINEFKKLDNNGNGTITENDLRKLMSNYENALSENEIEQILEEANVDEDGNIDYIRFTQVLLGKI
jgi:calmodulin